MPDPITPDIRTGFDTQTIFDIKLDTARTMDKVLNRPDRVAVPEGAYGYDIPQPTKSSYDISEGITYEDALISGDPKLKNLAIDSLSKSVSEDPYVKYSVGTEIRTPYELGKKYVDKKYGYDASVDMEDFYYQNTWGRMSTAGRIWRTPFKMLARIIPQAIFKFTEGLGYVGSMLTSIGSNNYWADVADNGMSKWLEGLEQDFKDQIIPVYKQAGYDEKGFFSKLTDSAFWNDEVSDAVAFMASAFIPASIFGKIGKIGAVAAEGEQAVNTFGRTFGALSRAGSFANKAGKVASSVGLGSPAELTTWAFNTSMESAMEGAQVFKTVTADLQRRRAQGDPKYVNLSDEDIREIAGKRASNDIGVNFAILGVSNAFENTLFFKPFKNIEGRGAIQIDKGLNASSKSLSSLGGLSRPVFYGKQAAKGLLFEGLWEENAQLAIQRVNEGNTDGRGFWSQLGKQTIDAFSGRDKEASESIGLGGLIGIFAPIGFSKISGERRQILANTKTAIDYANAARQKLFSNNDVYERDDNNDIIYDEKTKEAKVDKGKLLAKEQAYKKVAKGISFANKDEYFANKDVQYSTQKALSNYVRSLHAIGIEDISSKFANIDPSTAAIFGMDPSQVNKQSKEFGILAKEFENQSKITNELPSSKVPETLTKKEQVEFEDQRRSYIYDLLSDTVIIGRKQAEETSNILSSFNKSRNLSNASLSQFPVDQLNSLILQKGKNDYILKSEDFKEISEIEKEYHINKSKELEDKIEQYKTTNELLLKDSKKTSNGFYVPVITDVDGNKTEVKLDSKINLLQGKVADYQNIIDKNNHLFSLLSDKENSYSNWEKLMDTPLSRTIKEAIAKTEKKTNENEVVEENPGDFNKILDHVKKTTFDENYKPSPETEQLVGKYSELVNKLLLQYKDALENNRRNILNRKLKTLQDKQQLIGNQVRAYRSRLEDKKTELEILQEEIEMMANQKRVDQERLAKAINKLTKDIQKVENWVERKRIELGNLENQIAILEQEIESGDLPGLRNALSELKEERDWINNQVQDTQTLVDLIKEFLTKLKRTAGRLFGKEFMDRLVIAYSDGINYLTEIPKQTSDLQNAKALLTELTAIQKQIEKKYEENKAEIDSIIIATDQFFKNQYRIITKSASTTDSKDDSITKLLTQDKKAFPIGANSMGQKFNEKDGFDGSTYQRPLHTKFYTTTFPYITDITKEPQDVQDHAAFLDYISDPSNSTEIKKKLGKGLLRAIAVTRSNVKQLGLEDLLKERNGKDKEGKPYGFNVENPALTHIEIIPVISEGGYLYYVDTQLNKLGKVGEDKPTKMVRRSLRQAAFKTTPDPVTGISEKDQYAIKYSIEEMNKAVEDATEWRKGLLEITKNDPIHDFEWFGTRGLPVKQKMADEQPARNPVIGNILPASAVTSQTVRVYSDPNSDPIINGETVKVPLGRPFIYTTTGVDSKGDPIHEQLHAADNQLLTPLQVATVTRVLQETMKNHIKTVLKIVNENKNFENDPVLKVLKKKVQETGLENLDIATKKDVFAEVGKIAKKESIRLFDYNYTRYLSHVIYGFGPLEKGKEPHPNQIYFYGTDIFFGGGNLSVSLDNPEGVLSDNIQKFLSERNHNIKYFNREEAAKATFIEYYVDDNKFKQRSWKHYSLYLLSEKNPDGSVRDSIPVTTTIQNNEQKKLDKSPYPYKYESRAISLRVPTTPIVKKEVKKEESAKPVPQAGTKKNMELVKEAFGTFSGEQGTEQPVQMADIKEADVKEADVKSTGNMAAVKEAFKMFDEIPPPSVEDPDSVNPFENNYRIYKGGFFEREEDLDSLIADIGRMVPQFPVERLKRAIQVTPSLQAMGQFLNNTIRLHDMAERGTGYHEVFEAVANRLLTNAEWRVIYKEFISRKGYFTDRPTGKRILYSQATAQEAKEEMAEEFMDYKLTGKQPLPPQTRSFFRILWDAIKKIFGNVTTIQDLFDKVNKGKLAKRSPRASDRFASNFKIKILNDLPVAIKKAFFDGATSTMFINLFNRPESIAEIDEIDLDDEQIYEPIKEWFKLAKKNTEKNIPSITDDRNKRIATKLVQHFDTVLNNWRDFVAGHKESIKHLKIKFEEDEELTEEEKNNRNRNDYTKDVFKADGKRSSSKSIRFLFNALLKMQFTGTTKEVNGRTTGTIKPVLSKANMHSLVHYDSFMLKALESFKDLGSFDKIEAKLRDMAGITKIEEIDNPAKIPEVISKLSQEKATWAMLYEKLFGYSDKIDEEAAWKLRQKFYNYVSKYSPQSYTTYSSGSSVVIIPTEKKAAFETITNDIENSISQNSNLIFRSILVDGKKYFIPIKEMADEVRDNGKIVMENGKPKVLPKKVSYLSPQHKTNLIKFLGLSKRITPELIKKLSGNRGNILDKILLKIRNELAGVSVAGTNITMKTADIFGHTSDLIRFLDTELQLSQISSQVFTVKNKPQSRHILPSFASRVIGEINNSETLEELYKSYPQTAALFAKDSIILSKLFKDGERDKSYQISLGYISGITDRDDNEGTETSKLEFHDKFFLQFNASLSGLYYSLPADSETEYVYNFGEIVDYSDDMLNIRGKDIINEYFLPKLKIEIDMIKEDSSRLLQLNDKHKITGTKDGAGSTIGKSLRFFKDILQYTEKGKSVKLLHEIYKAIDRGHSTEEIVTGKKFREDIVSAIKFYLQSETEKTKTTLKEYNIIINDGDGYIIDGINSYFLNKHSGAFVNDNGSMKMNEQQLSSLAQYHKINSILAHMEAFKIVHGDPAQYKDAPKRLKSQYSPVQQAYFDTSGKFNNWLLVNKNKAILEGEEVEIQTDDIFYTNFSDSFQSFTVDDFIVTNVDTINDLVNSKSEFAKRFIKNYEETNETDGQSIGTIQFIRQLLIKTGWGWTSEHEKYFQYDTALMRQELSKDGRYDYKGNTKLENLDKKIVDYYKKNPVKAAITPIKTMMISVDEDGQQIQIKHSIHTASYQLAKEYEMVDTYLDMLNDKDSLLNFKSAEKIGLEMDKNNQVTPYYSDPFTKNDLTALDTKRQLLNFRTIGIQVETQSTGTGQTLGSQTTKLSNLNLFEGGIPLDFKPEGLTKSERRELWERMSEEERLAESSNYRKVFSENGTVRTLVNLKIKNTIDTFNKLGIKWGYENGSFTTSIEDLTKVKEYILNELQRLEIDQNTIDNIELTADKKAFINAAETTQSYTAITNLLWSMADKAITSFKVNGKSLVQVSSAFFNKKSRKAAYKNEDGTWTVVNSKAEYDKAITEGKNMVMTSSELGFYKKGNGETVGMEVYLPNIYLEKVNKARKKKGLNELSPEELMKHLNNNPKLLEGLGFRIPTQATSSLEFFTIKGFLPEIFGNGIVVPSGITTKAGGDFDVDKLNTYLNNWRLDGKGLPYYEEYVTTEENYKRNYEKEFLPKASLLKYIEREFKRRNIDDPSNTLINNIFNTDTDIVDDIAYEVFQENEYPDTYTLQDLVNDVKREEDNIAMSFEEWMKLPDTMKQSKGALENRYFESIRTILKSPEMFEYLLSPNSMDHVKKMRDIIFEAKGIEKEEKEINYTNLLSTEYIAEKRDQFTSGKSNIGIMAIAGTNYANSQITGIGINEEGGVTKEESYIFDELNNGDIYLPFEDVEMEEVNGKLIIPISVLKDKDGEYTMDKIAAKQNSAVDVTNDPAGPEAGIHKELVSTYLLATRIGLTGRTEGLFMQQPVIREFLNKLVLVDNRSYFGKPEEDQESITKIIEYLVNKYGEGGKSPREQFDSNYKFTDKQLFDLVRRGEEVKRGSTWTKDEKRAQYMALVTFLKMRMFAQHLFTNVNASNHDTASIRSPWIIEKKEVDYENTKKTSLIVKSTPQGIISGAEALREGTSIASDVALYKIFGDLLGKMNLFALQKENPKNELKKILRKTVRKNKYLTSDQIISIMKDYESGMIDILSNKVMVPGFPEGSTDYKKLREYGEELFSMNSPKSLKKKFEYIKEKYETRAKNNFFLSNLQFVTDNNLGIDTMELKTKYTNNDVTTKELYTEALLELAMFKDNVDSGDQFENFYKHMSEFYKAVVYGAYIQFGIKYGKKSFIDIIPVSTSTNEEENRQLPLALTDITRAALNMIDKEDFSTFEEQVKRTGRKDIVPEKKQFSLQFLSPNPKNPSELLLEGRGIWRSGKSKPPAKVSQIFFGRQDENGIIQPFIYPVMVWSGYLDKPTSFEEADDIISIPAIKPDPLYLEPVSDRSRGTYQATPLVYSMMKMGDYSYMFNQLFKKVGAEDPSLGRSLITKDNKGRQSISYLYKPINSSTSSKFNEKIDVRVTPFGTTIGSESILYHPHFVEVEDNQLISSIGGKNMLKPVVQPDVTTVRQSMKPKHESEIESQSNTKKIEMSTEDIVRVAKGTKKIFITSPTIVGKIGIPSGQSDIRTIGGTPYLIYNKGFINVQQAGGLEEVLKNEGLDTEKSLKNKQVADWIQGKGKLFVYTISSVSKEGTSPQLQLSSSLDKADKALDNRLIEFLKPVGITVEQLDTLKDRTGVDAIGAADIINKIILVNKNKAALDTLPEETAHFFVELLGNQHPTVKAMMSKITQWEGYQAVKDEYNEQYKGDENKIKKEAIGKLIGQYIVKNKSLSTTILEEIKKFIKEALAMFDIHLINIEDIAEDIASDILSRDYSKIRQSLPSGSRLVEYGETMKKNPHVREISDKLRGLGFYLTGSLALRKQGTVYRTEGEQVNDLDFKVPESLRDTWQDVMVENFRGRFGNEQRSFSRKNEDVFSFTIDGIDVDFFVNKVSTPEATKENFTKWQDILSAKLGMDEGLAAAFGRTKDVRDFLTFTPNEKSQGFDNPASVYFQLDRPALIKEALKHLDLSDELVQNMVKADPEEYLKLIASQYWGMKNTRKKSTFDFTPGTGLDSIPDEVMEIAKELFPQSEFYGPDNLPKITC